MANITFKSLLFFMQKRFVQTTISPSISSSSFTVQYLVKSCGFPLEAALLTSQKLQLDRKKAQNYESFVSFLKSQGFSDTHIVKLITKRPLILRTNASEKLKLKFQFLKENGFVGSLLPEVILANPDILRSSLDGQIKPSFDFLKKYLQTSEKVFTRIRDFAWLLTYDRKGRMQQNVDFLISERVPMTAICKLIMVRPRCIMITVKKIKYVVNLVKQLGLQPDAPMFVHVLYVMTAISDSNWKRKVELFKSLGWSEDDIMSTLKHDPGCFSCSEDKIKGAMNFYVNTTKMEPKAIINCPKLLTYSIEKRARPRYDLLQFLESKELLKRKPKFSSVLGQSEEKFLNNYVGKYQDKVPNLMELYHGSNKADKRF